MEPEYPVEILCRCLDCDSGHIVPQGLEYAGPNAAVEDVSCADCGAVFRQRFVVQETVRVEQGGGA